MSLEWFDQRRFEQEWTADQDVLASLREQGDRSEQPRVVDVSFRGTHAKLVHAEKYAARQGYQAIELAELDNDEWRLTVSRSQNAEAATIKHLTITALQIEAACGVVYDGWGCITQNDKA